MWLFLSLSMPKGWLLVKIKAAVLLDELSIRFRM